MAKTAIPYAAETDGAGEFAHDEEGQQLHDQNIRESASTATHIAMADAVELHDGQGIAVAETVIVSACFGR